MVWGQTSARGIEDLVQRVAANDPKLQSLTILRQRRFNHDDVASLVGAMASNTHLTELYASSHPLAPPTATHVADMLASNVTLRSLCVGDSSLGDDGVTALSRGVGASASLTRLDLTGKGVGPRGAAALATALAAATPLSHLVLSNNPQLGNSGLGALCSSSSCNNGGDTNNSSGNGQPGADGGDVTSAVAATSSWACREMTLELQGCGVGAVGVRALAESPSCAAKLVAVHLEGNELGPDGGRAVQELLKSATQLRALHLRGTELGDEGGEALAGGLAASTSSGGGVAIVDMAECGLGARTMAALRDAFAAGARLEQLSLAGNPYISDADVAALGGALATGQQGDQVPLAHLDLSGTQAGALALGALACVPGLRNLSLVGCPLGDAGAAALATSMAAADSGSSGASWAALKDLCISGSGLSLAAAGAVFVTLAAGGMPGLQSLEIGANPATQDDDFPALMETLRAARPDLAVFWRSGDDPAPAAK